MEFNEGFVQQQYQAAYNYALYKLGNSSQAEDVAAQTVNLFILKSDTINSDKFNAWIRSTCLNYCRKYYDNTKKENFLQKGLRESLINFFGVEHDGNLTENFRQSMENLDELEARSLVLYFNCGQNIKKMSEVTGESHVSLRKRISRIKMKLKAETYKNLGYIATKKIIVPKLHEAIIQFVRRLKNNIENNTIDKMFYYFSESNTQNFNPDFDIQKIKDYEVILCDGKYKIYLFYLDSQQHINNIIFSFFLNDKNQLKISGLPKKQRKLAKITKSTESARELSSLLEKYPENRQGLIKIPQEVMQKLTESA
ncbi:MAG: sigma-70 family RNA polymerase sigma factor [Candidatus Cloacimonetes bacterium]|nr:sigma-70 family RNA polymerase sigma factor [Candidatus Cloacimonadota bacterium]